MKHPGADIAAGRPLFVSRPLFDYSGLLEWAADEGFREPIPAAALHVTVALSRYPIRQSLPECDNADLIVRKGRRLVCRFGGVAVLTFSCRELSHRHAQFRRAGASWDYPTYRPHITFAIDDHRDLSRISPYRGPLHFGPESYKEPFDDYAWSELPARTLT